MENEKKFISLLSDYGFKVAFADESNTLFLRKALQALIKSEIPIKKVQFLRNEFVGITEESRGGVFDLVCEDEKQRTFIVEMQLGYYKHFIQRAKFYAFQKFNTLVEKGEYRFDNLTPIYCIGFLAKGIFPKSKEYYHFARLTNQKNEELDDQITHIIVEINKFDKEEKDIQSNLDKLIFIMKNLGNIKGADQLPKFLTEDWIKQAMDKLDKSQMTSDQRMNYEMMMAKNATIIEMLKEDERQQIAKEASEKGAKEKAIETAKNFKELGVENEVISKATGLTIEEIENL